MSDQQALPDFMLEQEGLTWALARAQYSFPAINKGHEADAGKYKYKYASLADVLTAIRPALNREGIALVQTTEITEAGVELVTSLLYGDERLSSRWPLPIQNAAPQQVGSVLTYLRRYALCALVGIAAEDDDDGRAASGVRQSVSDTQISTVTTTDSKPPPHAPDDWETRPLASMTFTELRGVAEKVGHAFSGGSKSELIRTLQPVMDARTGAEPWDMSPVEGEGARPSDSLADVGPGDSDLNASRAPSRPEPDAIPFQPVVAEPKPVQLMDLLEVAVAEAKANRTNPVIAARAHLTGSERKQRDAVARDLERGN